MNNNNNIEVLKNLHNKFLRSAGVCTDTRSITAGSMFFALRGTTFNGNDFVADALLRGACCAVTDEPKAAVDERCVVVGDVTLALQQLAQFHRKYLGIPIIAITGTNGKTTTKELLHRVLSRKYNTAATQGNLNNHIGVPLTLLAMNRQTEMGIVEMGANHAGEIARLCEIAQPTAGCITNVGKAHLEGFGSLEGVRNAKGELYQHLARCGGHIFVYRKNADLVQMLRSSNAARYTIYDETTLHTQTAPVGSLPYFCFSCQGKQFATQLTGSYNAANVWCAIAIGLYFGVPIDGILDAVVEYRPSNNRSQLIDTGSNRVVMDAYNANPASMAAALKDFGAMAGNNKCLIIGEMLELGSSSEEEHRQVVRQIEQAGFREVMLVGSNFAALPEARQYACFADAAQLAARLKAQPLQHRLILVKGSHGVRLETIISLL